jgi:hypothetical protein
VRHVSLRFNGDVGDQELMDMRLRTYTSCTVEVVGTYGGVTEDGYREYTRRKDAYVKIATVIASNSGRPGGACRALDGSLDVKKIHANHKTQEEDVISCWLIAEARGKSGSERTLLMNELFSPVSNAFGLKNPGGTDPKTIQRVNYIEGQAVDVKRMDHLVVGSRVYADAWCYEGATVCEKRVDTGGPVYDTGRTYPTTLVFCAAPNAQDPDGSKRRRSKESSMRRTYSRYANEKDYFDSGVAWAVYTALYASAMAGCNVVVLPFVGGGVYAGRHKESLDVNEFRNTVEAMIDGDLPDKQKVPALRPYFQRVAIVTIGKPASSHSHRSHSHRSSVPRLGPAAPSGSRDAVSGPTLPVTLKPMGVLGYGNEDRTVARVDENHAIVDPAGLTYIQRNNPAGAGKLSGAIYRFLRIDEFPQDVIQSITEPGQAVYQAYHLDRRHVHVIHVVGPDFSIRDVPFEHAVNELKRAYTSVIDVAEALSPSISVIRVPLISGGAFSGNFGKRGLVPELTARAVLAAFHEHRHVQKQYWLCTFGPIDAYERAFYAATSTRVSR